MSERELLKRAYKLLEDIASPFRNVERYDVKKWLEDATLVLNEEDPFALDPKLVGDYVIDERWKVSRWEE